MSQLGNPDGTKTGIGSVASEETRLAWKQAWDYYTTIRGPRADRISKVAEKFGLSRKGAKRRIKNYEGWQVQLTGSLPPDPFRAETIALGNAMLVRKRAEQRSSPRRGYGNSPSSSGRPGTYRNSRPGYSRPSGERDGNTIDGNRPSTPGRGSRY